MTADEQLTRSVLGKRFGTLAHYGRKCISLVFFRQFIIAYPLAQNKLINLGAFVMRHNLENTEYDGPWVEKSSKDDILVRFATWEQEAKDLIDVSRCPVLSPEHVTM